MAKKSGFGGMGNLGMGGLQNMVLKQVQKMQADQERAIAELDEARVEASAGGGVVTAVATGNGDMVSIKIHPDAVDPDDVEMLEDLVLAAVKEALARASALREEKLAALMPKIPGLTL